MDKKKKSARFVCIYIEYNRSAYSLSSESEAAPVIAFSAIVKRACALRFSLPAHSEYTLGRKPNGALTAMTVFTYNGDARIAAAKAALEKKQDGRRIHILPIPTRADEGVERALLGALQSGDLVCAYAPPPPLTEAIRARGAHLFNAEGDEGFIGENATLTAEITLGYILSLPRAPADLSVGIIGYGRIGQALCRMLLFFGARVRVFTGRKETRAALGEAGIESRPIRYEAGEAMDLSGIDLLIQTAPAKVFTKENAPPYPLWNLAAAPFVGEGVAVRQLSALPAKVTYESGGLALARAVLRFFETENERKTL